MIKLIKDTLKNDIHNQAKVFHRKKRFYYEVPDFHATRDRQAPTRELALSRHAVLVC